MRRRRAAAQTMVEAAIVFPLLVLVMIGLVQFAVFIHVRNVVVTSIQEGAHVAAARGDHLDEGRQRARDLIDATLGSRMADRIRVLPPTYVREDTDQEAVRVVAQGSFQTVMPWINGGGLTHFDLPLNEVAEVSRERFRAPR